MCRQTSDESWSGNLNEVWVAHRDINSYYKPASSFQAGTGLLTPVSASSALQSAGAERHLQAAFLLSLKGQHSVEQPGCHRACVSQSSPASDDRVLLQCGCHTGSVSPGWRSLWDVCGGVWWNPAVLWVKPDWQWTLAASPENNIISVRALNCTLVSVLVNKGEWASLLLHNKYVVFTCKYDSLLKICILVFSKLVCSIIFMNYTISGFIIHIFKMIVVQHRRQNC